MLDYFCIFARGGALLWTYQLTALKGGPVDALIRNCLLQERVGDKSYNYEPPQGASYTLKWTLHNGAGLVFVAVYQKALSLLYVDALLEKIKKDFAVVYKPDLYNYKSFDDTFKRVLKECELRADQFKRPLETHPPAAAPNKVGMPRNGSVHVSGARTEEKENDEDDDSGWQHEVEALTNGVAVENGNSNKVKRTWEEHGDVDKLDFSDQQTATTNGNSTVVPLDVKSKMEDSGSDDGIDEEEMIDAGQDEDINHTKKNGVLVSFVKSISVNVMGTNALTREDLQQALDDMKRKLMERNVAEEIAGKLCNSVAGTLVGQKLGSFTRVSTTVRQAFQEALVRMLTPNRTINILSEIEKSKSRKAPYVIIFVGVNGVGKSTNLAKVAFWLLQNKLKVMIAACDTFRAGAVEQLRTHAQRLQVPLYERGYEKDAAKVAYEACRQAERDSCDVLLVDTAGRMQDNDPLMRALTNLINVNHPDLVLFVGEALVGNDAVDQLTKFNQRLADLATTPKPHLIDGVLLTKFDTIDDKVGAALSMVYTSGAPIMFVGCGQTYQDLRRLNVKSVVKSLLA